MQAVEPANEDPTQVAGVRPPRDNQIHPQRSDRPISTARPHREFCVSGSIGQRASTKLSLKGKGTVASRYRLFQWAAGRRRNGLRQDAAATIKLARRAEYHNSHTLPSTPNSAIPPFLQLHLLVFLFAITGILAPFISLQAPSLVFWRTLIAALTMGLLLAVKRPALLRIPTSDIAKAIGIGFIIGLHWICFFTAIELSNISVGLVGFAAMSFFTAFTEPLIDRRPIRLHEIFLGCIVAGGIALIVGVERGHLLGLSVALLCALLAAIFPVLNHRLVNRGLSSRSLLVYEMSGACIVAVIYLGLAPNIDFDTPIATDWIPLLTLALLCTVFAHTLHIHLLRRLSAYTSSLAMNFEPVHGIVLAALIFQEHKTLHPGFYLGALTIIAANIAQPILDRRRRARARPV